MPQDGGGRRKRRGKKKGKGVLAVRRPVGSQ
jgi:hypothetical protein